MPRALIVTSMLQPYLAADSHRARILAHELPRQGWDVELLVPGNAFHSADFLEPHADLLEVSAPVHRASPEWAGLFRLVNSRTLSWRAYGPLRRVGNALLSKRRFDLVYISCSQANLFHLGVGWRRRFGVPFIIDLHDPWYTPIPGRPEHLPNWKRQVGNALARNLERATLKRAAGIVSVSSQYLEALNQRYAGERWDCLLPERQATIPFGPAEEDFRAARQVPTPLRASSGEGGRTIVYTGAGGPIMERSFREICRLLAATRQHSPRLLAGVKLELFGTEPRAAGREPLLSRIASHEGVADLVCEFPARVGYLEALRRVEDADGLLVLGVTDPAYCPSKLFLYALSGKPMLACMISGTTVQSYFDTHPDLGRLVRFGPDSEISDPGAPAKFEAFMEDVQGQRITERRGILESFLAPEMTRRHLELFEACIGARANSEPSELQG